MIRLAMLLVALPMTALFAQAVPIHLSITAANNAEFRLVRDSATFVLGGRAELAACLSRICPTTVSVAPVYDMLLSTGDDKAEPVSFIAHDTSSRVHVEATQGNHVIATGDGAFVIVRRVGDGVSIEARDHVLPSDVRKP